MKKKILVTGGAGFIGSHLCTNLIDKGHQVLCLDNLFTGKLENISHLKSNSSFSFIKHDIINPFFAEDLDEIYNLACPASPVYYQYNPIKTVKTCTIGVINMLGLARKQNAKILQASTSEIYGDPLDHPQKESYFGNVNTVGIRSCYDEGKRCAETLFMDYHREHSLKIKIARIFNTYGPNISHNDGRVVSNFITQAICDKNITIYGDGSQTRSFMYIEDLINGLIMLMNTNDNCTNPINLGNPNEITIKDLALKIIKITNSKSKITYQDLPENDPLKRKPDIDMANKVLEWMPIHNLDFGLKKTIDYFKNTNEIN
tara:strand:- start:686 stop:1633 length:948 start_codon:yes stop_codon:yes gene_type:complete